MSRDDQKRAAELDPLPDLRDPPTHLTAAERALWFELRALAPDVLRECDGPCVELAVQVVAVVRGLIAAGVPRAEWMPHARFAYRCLGDVFMPMPARRELIFGGHARPGRRNLN